MGMIKQKWGMMLRTSGGMLATGLLAGFCLTIGNVSLAIAEKFRKFYLTQDTFVGNQVLTACASEYHTASLWEILEPSNLEYDTKRGATKDDAGAGPPTGSDGEGWIRTGYFSSTGSSAGHGNCRVWTSSSPAHNGTRARLEDAWGSTTLYPVSPWLPSSSGTCNISRRVWCVNKP